MFNKIVSLLGICLFGLQAAPVQSQSVVFVAGAGAAKYRPAGEKRFQKIKPGAVLREDCTFSYSGNGNATLCNAMGRCLQIPAGKYVPSAVFETNANKTLGFDNTFGAYVIDAIYMAKVANMVNADWAGVTDPKKTGDGWGVTDPKKTGDGWGVTDPKKTGDGWGVTDPKKTGDGWGVTDPKKTGDGWGVTDPKKTGDGWGGKGSRIHGIMPFGKIRAGKVRFSWSRPAEANAYNLEIRNEAGEMVKNISCRDTFIDVDLTELPDGSHYLWEVAAAGNPGLHSAALEFALSRQDELDEVVQRLEQSKLYKGGDPVLRGLMESIAMERADWFYAAHQRYAGLKRDFPDNTMIRMLYAAFWTRFDLAPMAHASIRAHP